MKNLIRTLYNNHIIRYVFFGGCTTLVNLVSFFLLRRAHVELNTANIISIVIAILFAYVVNSRFVFEDHPADLKGHLAAFFRFIGARALTMIIEVGGVWLLVGQMGMQDMIGKTTTQVLVLILNYVFSRFFVFKNRS